MTHAGQRLWAVLLAAILATALAPALSPLAGAARAQAAAPDAQPADPLAQGGSLYEQGRFTEGVALLRSALGRGALAPADLGPARELLARLLIKAGRRDEARATFRTMLRSNGAYRPDAEKVPPDERAIFDEALRAFHAEEIAQGRRVPASVGVWYGYGRYSLSQVNDAIHRFDAAQGITGTEEIRGDPEFGGSVRIPLRPRLAVEVELIRFNSSVSDSGRPSRWYQYPTKFQVTAVPLVVNLHFAVRSSARTRLHAFAGAGPMLVTELLWTRYNFDWQQQQGQFGSKTGFYGQLGMEGEYLLHPRVAVSGRVLGRLARTANLIEGSRAYQTESLRSFVGKAVDFSGFGLDVGLRFYIGA